MSTYAIIDLGGKQLRVEPGRFYDAHLFSSFKSLLSESNTKIIIFRVLMISHGTEVQFGYPWLKNASVKARILHKKQNDKMLIYKMRSKKKTRKKFGHRQKIARFIVDAIQYNGQTFTTNLK
uniref:Large ribosomal subunit protein bL21c n=1 Tax=Chaetosphaeridium globosum TaxID=96477 RepID=RK21_CHAGL|nr:ribosomal protein L21 [Chaetosphaeridium globosum]Q8M9U4.1 RecName: Full=Large ribosomal subunit protein bL21c; AltName: Full=50S ribosomal protein L21, chloroplastic [Chaetosphaeridium globosum]AAM96558.1 ribosomal protein L21 [Chaetosphaeridium globosum]